MRLDRMTCLGTARAAAALAALLAVSAPVAAQSLIDIAAETATARAGKWVVSTDATAGGGKTMRHPDAGAAKITTAKASPTDYFEVTFSAAAGVPYQITLLGKADQDYWGNDSVFIQFSGSVNASGTAIWRIGTSSATEVNLEDCSGCGLSGWKWQDNAYGVNVAYTPVYFATRPPMSPKDAIAWINASSTCLRYQCRSFLCRLRSMIGYPTSCPGPWNVISPPRSTSNSSTPRDARYSGDAMRFAPLAVRPSVTTGRCSTR